MNQEFSNCTDELTSEFIAAGIDTGFTFAGVAATEWGREAQAKAQAANDEALGRIMQSEGRGLSVGNLRERLRDLEDRLASLAGAEERP